jgi:hypothetical protein
MMLLKILKQCRASGATAETANASECANGTMLCWGGRIQSGAAAPHSKRLASFRLRAGVCRLVLLMLAFIFAVRAWPSNGAEPWQEALAAMPLGSAPAELNRFNCVQTLLAAFQSNSVVKAIVFMPGATDEFYLFRRAQARLTNSSPTLLEAVTALTNQTFIHVTFRAPFVLLHTAEDPLASDNLIQDQKTARRLRTQVLVRVLNCYDWDWDALQPVLKHSLRIALRPWRFSRDSWHFYRHSFAAYNLNGLEALELAALAGKSKFTLRRGEAIFEVDPRVQVAAKFDSQPR